MLRRAGRLDAVEQPVLDAEQVLEATSTSISAAEQSRYNLGQGAALGSISHGVFQVGDLRPTLPQPLLCRRQQPSRQRLAFRHA